MAMGKGYRVFQKIPPDRETVYSVLLDNKVTNEALMFESGAVVHLTSGEMDLLRKQYTKVVDAYGCLGVMNINAGNDNIKILVMVTSCLSVGKIGDSDVFRITGIHFHSLRNVSSDEDRVSEVKKLLGSGTFYFTWAENEEPWDLSLCAQRTLQDHDTDNRFFWNRMLHVHFQRYGIDCSKWLIKAMCGSVEIRTVYAGHRQAKACLISRLSCERAGTRFNVRGSNDDGNVANFVETEQVIFLEKEIASFVQTRGSVPLFWEQPGIQVGSHKVHMSRGYEMSAPSYDRHLRTIRKQYGEQVIVNLLGRREGEKMLSQAFQNHHDASAHRQDVPFIHFDYHSEIKGTNLKNLDKLKSRLMKHMDSFGFFFTSGNSVTHQQTGTLRTNCLDCLDRTNATQNMIGMEILIKQLDALGLSAKPQMVGRFQEVYKQIWSHNGDHISRIYTGTGALGGGRSKYSDASRSATRTIQNNFLDSSKQEAIDVLLMGSALHGNLADRARALLSTRYLHASENILRQMTQSYQSFTHRQKLRICVGTYNVNGGKHYRSIAYKHQSLADWLLDAHKTHENILVEDVDFNKPVDIFAVGLEEIIDLNASNIMSASTTNAREWQKEILKTISRDHKYVLVTSIQLVGVVLFVLVRPGLAPFIRDVAVDKVKTGMGGATGNKGGVAIRFVLNSTSMCFVCAHLAAGQSQVSDRNADYAEITRKMSFPMTMDNPARKGRTILSHDCVFWCGDFNYRIDLGNEEVKELIADKNWTALNELDQLNVQRGLGNAFQGFSESDLNFAPTYKYDTFSDDYDTSEKNRCPAWTDRVLWREKTQGENDADLIKPLLYTRAELRTSDHRPVMCLFDVDTLKVDEDKKNSIIHDVIDKQGPPDGTVIVSVAPSNGGGTDLELSDETVNEVVEKFNEVGDIVIVRFVGSDMWVFYQDGPCAVEALQFDGHTFGGMMVSVRLKTSKWKQEIEQELNLCARNTEPLYNQFTNSLLGDDFSIPSMDFEDDDDELEDAEVESSLHPPTPSGQGSRSPSGSPNPFDHPKVSEIPGGPPLTAPLRPSAQPARPSPPASALGSREDLAKARTSPCPDSRQPPARPSAPPAKPPPPQRPPGAPQRTTPTPPSASANATATQGVQNKPSAPASAVEAPSAADSASAPPKIRQPLRPPPSAKASKKVKEIGRPTNVTHHGHASSIEEAQAMIQKLMTSTGDTGEALLPGSLVPSKSDHNLAANADKLSAPKPVPRSKTSTDIATEDDVISSQSNLSSTSQQQQQPKPVPRRNSSNNILIASSDNSSSSSNADNNNGSLPEGFSSSAIARPRPVPRRDVKSCINPNSTTSSSTPAATESESFVGGELPEPVSNPSATPQQPPPPVVSGRPAPPPPSSRPTPPPPASRPTPPPPASRPSPTPPPPPASRPSPTPPPPPASRPSPTPPPPPKPASSSSSSSATPTDPPPEPPARPSRPSGKSSPSNTNNTNSTSSSQPTSLQSQAFPLPSITTDPFSTTQTISQDQHILDRNISLTEESATPDPFDTAFAKTPLPFSQSSTSSLSQAKPSSDPFDTSSIQQLPSSNLSSSSDPFAATNSSNDPFSTPNSFSHFPSSAEHNQPKDPFDTNGIGLGRTADPPLNQNSSSSVFPPMNNDTSTTTTQPTFDPFDPFNTSSIKPVSVGNNLNAPQSNSNASADPFLSSDPHQNTSSPSFPPPDNVPPNQPPPPPPRVDNPAPNSNAPPPVPSRPTAANAPPPVPKRPT